MNSLLSVMCMRVVIHAVTWLTVLKTDFGCWERSYWSTSVSHSRCSSSAALSNSTSSSTRKPSRWYCKVWENQRAVLHHAIITKQRDDDDDDDVRINNGGARSSRQSDRKQRKHAINILSSIKAALSHAPCR